jgi:hypothetical protein
MRVVRGLIQLPSNGLREAVLRVSLEDPSCHRSAAARHDGILADVRRWQRGQGCTREQWRELQRLCGVPGIHPDLAPMETTQ